MIIYVYGGYMLVIKICLYKVYGLIIYCNSVADTIYYMNITEYYKTIL